MDADLHDLLAAWTGAECDEARRATLLARLRDDAAFRRAFAAEARLLAKLKVVQSTDPRWLRLEDHLGWLPPQPPEERIASGVMDRLPPAPRQRPRRWWLGAAAALAALLALAVVTSRPQTPTPAERGALAVVAEAEGVSWTDAGPVCQPGEEIGAGRYRLRTGHLTLALMNGVVLDLAAPVDLELPSANRVLCHGGRLRVHVPDQARGFTVTCPDATVVDLGTEIGVNVIDGLSTVRVFTGRAEVFARSPSGAGMPSQVVEAGTAVRLDAASGRIVPSDADATAFAPARPFRAPPLRLAATLPSLVLAQRPWGYWRFGRLEDGRIPNEVPGAPALVVHGSVALDGPVDGNRSLVLDARDADRWLEAAGPWTFVPDRDFAIELWFLRDSLDTACLVSLIARRDDGHQGNVVQLEALRQPDPSRPMGLRFLHRWPPGGTGGINAIAAASSFRWHHAVAQKAGGRIELWVDGQRMVVTGVESGQRETSCRVLVGRLSALDRTPDPRSFGGRIDELAIYPHALTAEDILAHARQGMPGASP